MAAAGKMKLMTLDDYKVVLYRNKPDGWVAEVPAIPGCHVLMSTRESALAELAAVFQMIAEEYRERGQSLPADTTEIVNGAQTTFGASPKRSVEAVRENVC